MKRRTHYRTIFLSDTHLGFRGAQAKHLLAFLKSVECDYLYLVGDIFDFWAMRNKIWWDHHCDAILRRILKMIKTGTKVVYLPGNHDEVIRTFIPILLGSVEVVNETTYTTQLGKRYSVFHGDHYDVVVGKLRWLALLGSTLYDWLLWANSGLHHLRVRMGYPTYWSLAKYLKAKAKIAFIRDFEKAIVMHAKKNNCTGVICGHIHTPKIVVIDGIEYVNCGDWVESLTAVVENDAGYLELVNHHDLNHVGYEDDVMCSL